MNDKLKSNNKFLHILILTCFFYLPLNITINLLCSLGQGKLLKIWANFILFAIAFIFAIFVGLKTKFTIKSDIIRNTCPIFVIISFVINLFVYIIEDGKIWTLNSIFVILVYSVAISTLLKCLRIKAYLLRTLIYYCVSLASFMILTVGIAKYTSGNSTMLLFGIFTISYAIVSIVYFFIKRAFSSFENEEKTYKRQFD